MRLSDDVIAYRLETWPVARLATTTTHGQPHLVPIVFARVGDQLWSSVDGKPKAAREPTRVHNVRRHPKVALLLDEYGDDWSRLWWIRVDATGAIARGPSDHAGFTTAIEALRAKYPQYGSVDVVRDPPLLLCFDIERIRSWRPAASCRGS